MSAQFGKNLRGFSEAKPATKNGSPAEATMAPASSSFELKHMIGHFNPNKPQNNRFMATLLERYREYYQELEKPPKFCGEGENRMILELLKK